MIVTTLALLAQYLPPKEAASRWPQCFLVAVDGSKCLVAFRLLLVASGGFHWFRGFLVVYWWIPVVTDGVPMASGDIVNI